LLNGDLTLVPADFFERGTVAIAALYKLFDLSAQQLDGLLASRIERSETNFYTILVGSGLVLLLVLYFFAGLLFSVLRSLKAIGAGAERLARGDLSKLQNAREAAKETLRIKIALDNTSSAVMIADNEGFIRYQNKALMALMQRVESVFRKALPGFTAAGLLGAYLDQFHKSPNHQQSILANLKGEHRTQIHVAGVHLRLIVNPII